MIYILNMVWKSHQQNRRYLLSLRRYLFKATFCAFQIFLWYFCASQKSLRFFFNWSMCWILAPSRRCHMAGNPDLRQRQSGPSFCPAYCSLLSHSRFETLGFLRGKLWTCRHPQKQNPARFVYQGFSKPDLSSPCSDHAAHVCVCVCVCEQSMEQPQAVFLVGLILTADI